MTDLPIQKVLKNPDVAGRMVKWVVGLSEFDIRYEPRGPIKGLVFADFVVELSSGAAPSEGLDFRWVLSVDGSSNQQGSGAGVILEGPNGVLIEQSLRFAFKASNNQAEYEALIADGVLPLDPSEAKRVKKRSSKFTLIDGDLFKFGFTHPVLVCVHGQQCTRIMSELHEGVCGSHVGGRALASRVLRAGYYWPTLKEDCVGYAQRCK
ncbi:uncharacterized protein [Phaseolus vulgaris]|uniref:uncharacterized protein n=1 Tax=Phaseolus vulgaris TaxID=3885 RepID=UPI0035CABAC9